MFSALSILFGGKASKLIPYVIGAVLVTAVLGIVYGAYNHYNGLITKISDLEGKNAQLVTEIDGLISANSDLKDKNDALEKSNKINIDVIDTNCQEKRKIQDGKNSILEKRKQKESQIMASPATDKDPILKISSELTIEPDKAERLSEVRIDSIWEAFCSADPTANECVKT